MDDKNHLHTKTTHTKNYDENIEQNMQSKLLRLVGSITRQTMNIIYLLNDMKSVIFLEIFFFLVFKTIINTNKMVLCSTGIYVNMNKGIISKLCNQVTYKNCVLVFLLVFQFARKTNNSDCSTFFYPIGILAKTHFFHCVFSFFSRR